MRKLKNRIIEPTNTFWKSIKRDEPIYLHTTLEIGGPAKYFIEVKNTSSLIRSVRECRKNGIDYCLIGGGSDLLVSDKGYNGMLILNKISYIREKTKGLFTVGSGTVLLDFINYAVDKGYGGLEKMSGIPGTVGGAVYGNAGAYGQTISDKLVAVTIFDGKRKRTVKKERCGFEYRGSLFKKNKTIIIEAVFSLEKGEKEFLKKVSLDTIQLRAQKYYPGIKCPGSFFKNIPIDRLKPNQLKRIPSDKISYGKIPAGYLMESVGAKGAVKGMVKIADYHGNLIINTGNASSEDFISLADFYAGKVEKKFGIKLEPEVQLLGFNNDIK